MRQSLDELVRRHEILRTRFVIAGDEPRARGRSDGVATLAVVDVDGDSAAARQDAAMQQLLVDAARPFDLARGPVLRATLYRLGCDQAILLLAMHHIVCDGWSMAVLLRRARRALRGRIRRRGSRLPPLAVQYGDFAAWQWRPEADAELATQLAYWDRPARRAPADADPAFRAAAARTPTGRGGTLSLTCPMACAARWSRSPRARGRRCS